MCFVLNNLLTLDPDSGPITFLYFIFIRQPYPTGASLFHSNPRYVCVSGKEWGILEENQQCSMWRWH